MDVSPSLSPSRDSDDPRRPRPPGRESHWLVDGYNVLHAALLPGELRSRTQWWNEEGRERLIRRVCSFKIDRVGGSEENGGDGSDDGSECSTAAQTGETTPIVWIVFDGDRAAPQAATLPAHIRIIFAPSADDYLVSRSRRAEANESIYVVSSDKRVAGRCAHAGARIIKPLDFLARCPEPEDPSPKPTGADSQSTA